MKLKTNDNVRVITGKDRNKSGKVIQIFQEESKIVVEGMNLMKKHMRTKKQGEKGQRIELSGPMDASNVMLVCPKCSKATRVGYKIEAKNKKRVCRKCKEIID